METLFPVLFFYWTIFLLVKVIDFNMKLENDVMTLYLLGNDWLQPWYATEKMS